MFKRGSAVVTSTPKCLDPPRELQSLVLFYSEYEMFSGGKDAADRMKPACRIRYFSFNMLRRRPAMHIEGFNMHALEGAIHIARSISFVAVAAICIDETNIFLTSPAICIVLTIRWSMSNAMHIAVHNMATMCTSMHITTISMIVFKTFNTYCHIKCIA